MAEPLDFIIKALFLIFKILVCADEFSYLFFLFLKRFFQACYIILRFIVFFIHSCGRSGSGLCLFRFGAFQCVSFFIFR